MRLLAPTCLLAACLLLQGCLGGLLGTLTSPEAVVANTASNLVNEGARAIGGASEAVDTVSELDRIIANNPDAVNADELRALRGQLAGREVPEQTRPAGPPPPRDEFDRRLPPEPARDGAYHVRNGTFRNVADDHHGTVLVIQREVVDDLGSAVGRREVKSFTFARVSSLPPAREAIYQYGWNPDPQPLAPRRGAE